MGSPVTIRNIKLEAPNGYTWDQALDLLDQGYSFGHVASRTGFPERMLQHARAAARSQPVVARVVPVPVPVVPTRIEHVPAELTPRRVRGEISDEAMTYVFTDHAVERMRERKIEYADVLRIIDARDKVVARDAKFRRGWMHTQRFRYLHGPHSIVVVPDSKVVVTVSWRDEEAA